MIDKDKEIVWHPFTPQHENSSDNIFIERAEGVYLHTPDGRKIIDAISSWWVNIHGHSNPRIAKTLWEQANTLEHVIFAGFTHQPAIKLAENLLSILPENIKKVFYSDNGSTANEVAIKMAIQYWHNLGIKKKKIVALEGAYHGDTFGAMAVGDRNIFTTPFTDYLFEVAFVDLPTKENQDHVINKFESLLQTGEVGIFIFEPLVQGAAGMRIYDSDTLDLMLKIAKKHNVICIADEVFTGFYRTGKFLASNYLSEQPDIIALSKGITGGTMPLGVTVCVQKIYDAYLSTEMSKAFLHGHSYTANPLACAVANTSFEILMEKTCQAQIQEIAACHQEFIKGIKNHQAILNIRALGTILAIEIRSNEKTEYTNPLRKKIYEYFLTKDILLRPLGNVIYLVPPYVITKDELKKIYQTILEFLNLV
ncbi:adenosylmethionine--8-amino-7-oxononanoate transaminase [Chryseotalea sanaruensis]|uniref:Adenosylmethionine-8-amino-7-oxononanoate aminotransferase n=1 Tax=Chryseotalea sanaruensis TaxID=2482724 RepID=A0A401UFJ2_9BACT|nr:adenosylmethionine--8-amino-7-oxononanoate transaminase [Chryseotalea sanaruensis]GCC53689.1 adenosylmethionine--8-amino-7-oxononanoate transaminase [Chryseotalea sanaruensis]